MIAIVDYGVGNLFSLFSSLSTLGQDAVVTGDQRVLADAQKLILPGVGAFCDAARALRLTGLHDAVLREAAKGKPLLGICLGMQMLFTKSYEYGEYEGLDLIPGAVKPISSVIPSDLKVPHIGWNALQFPDGRANYTGSLNRGSTFILCIPTTLRSVNHMLRLIRNTALRLRHLWRIKWYTEHSSIRKKAAGQVCKF